MGEAYYQYQKQAQIFQQHQKQEEALIEYYVYQDVQNLINLLYSRKAVLEHFQNIQNNPIVTLSNNKIILQLNLSNGIHRDLQQQYSNNFQLKTKLISEKKIALYTLKKVVQSLENQVTSQNGQQEFMYINDPVKQYLNEFIKKYEFEQFDSNQIELLETNQVAQFNEQVLQTIISSIQSIDAQTNQIRQNGSNYKPTQQELINRAEQYYYMTKDKLNQIYPQQNNQQCLINKQETYFQGQEGHLINPEKQQFINSSNSQQEQYFNIEKKILIEFLQFLGYFNQAKTQSKLINPQNLYSQVNHYLNNPKYQQQDEIIFAKKIFQFQDVLDHQIILHYNFQLFFDFLQQTRGYQNLQLSQQFQRFVPKIIGEINNTFFEYLYNQKEQIENFLIQNSQMHQEYVNSQNAAISTQIKKLEEDFIWQMYNGFCQLYQIQKN
ncbi:unnamed protein product [Paramecium primaurelia]|uniref:Uncharacterized protein n=1 Tax=Paramecium primaurelia TaxID=5886 RepID=A0A8S1JMG1_PARPR|nr:unnamed protein product [Paramecium primaurelia]